MRDRGAHSGSSGGGPRATAPLLQRLRAGIEDACWVHFGDSTGNEPHELVYIVALWLGTLFPAYTVLYYLWNDANQNYDAPIVLQRGTGSKTLSVYNGSHPGAIVSYSVTRLVPGGVDQAPVAPQLASVNYGYNQGTGVTTPFRYQLYDLTRRIENRFPGCGILLNAQPPVGAGAAIVNSDHMIRGRVALDLAATEGYDCVNALQAYLNNLNWLADWISSDQLHPNAAGQRVWAELLKQQFPLDGILHPRTPSIAPNRIWLPPSAFILDEGSPILGRAGASGSAAFPSWEFPNSAQAGIAGTIDYPDSWQYVNIYIHWSYASASGFTSGNNGVKWEVWYSRPSVTGPWPSPAIDQTNGVQNAVVRTTALSSASNGGPWNSRVVRVVSNTSIASRPLSIGVRRVAPGTSIDTMAEPAHLRGVMLERAG